MPTNSIMSMHIANRPDFIAGLDETMRSTSPRLVQQHRTPGLDDLLKTAITAKSFAKKKENTQKAVKLMQEDAMVVPIWMHKVFWPINPCVKNIKFNWPDHSHFTFRDTWLDNCK